MPYQLFLQTLTQLSSKQSATISLEQGTIHIQSTPGNARWRIRMSLLEGKEHIPSHLRSCIPSTGRLQLHPTGPYLQLNASTNTLALIDEIDIHKDRYTSFKKQITHFIEVSKEWHEVFAEMLHN